MAYTRVTAFSSSKLALLVYVSEDGVLIRTEQLPLNDFESTCDLCGLRARFQVGPVAYCRPDLEAMVEAEPERWYIPATQIRR